MKRRKGLLNGLGVDYSKRLEKERAGGIYRSKICSLQDSRKQPALQNGRCEQRRCAFISIQLSQPIQCSICALCHMMGDRSVKQAKVPVAGIGPEVDRRGGSRAGPHVPLCAPDGSGSPASPVDLLFEKVS